MKVAQITEYSKEFHIAINEIAMPEIKDHEVLVKVKAAGVNPVDILIANGSIRLVQDYKFPLTLGNELAGVIEKVGNKVKQLQKVATILESNHIKPTLDSVYHFTQISQALDKVAQGHAQGKVVVTFE